LSSCHKRLAEHVVNKISSHGSENRSTQRSNIPARSPFVQWLTSDSSGNIWFAEQRGNSLGVIKPSLNPLQSSTNSAGSLSSPTPSSSSQSNNKNNSNSALPQLGFSYADVVGPTVALGIIFSAVIYAGSVISLRQSENVVSSIKTKHDNNSFNNNRTI
jgi:copper transport protein